MSIELDRPGGGVAAFMLSVGTLLALEKNGTLANDGGGVLGKTQGYRCGDERAKPSRMGSRCRSPRATSRPSRSRSEPATARLSELLSSVRVRLCKRRDLPSSRLSGLRQPAFNLLAAAAGYACPAALASARPLTRRLPASPSDAAHDPPFGGSCEGRHRTTSRGERS